VTDQEDWQPEAGWRVISLVEPTNGDSKQDSTNEQQ
jgi:hypothetical protein